MRNVLRWLAGLSQAGPFTLATVVSARGSVPMPPGSSMAIADSGLIVGGVSGGCVDSDVCARAEVVRATGQAQYVRYRPSGDPAAVALTCGGVMSVLIERVAGAELERFWRAAGAVLADRPVARAVAIPHVGRSGGRETAWTIDGLQCGARLPVGFTADFSADSAAVVAGQFVTVIASRPRMLLFGSSPFVTEMCALGAFLGYTVTVCDARRAFLDRSRFSAATEIVADNPGEYLRAELEAGRTDTRTVVLAMTHMERFDVGVLTAALRAPRGIAYIGALGSAATVAARKAALARNGFSKSQIARVSMPAGLGLGGRSPTEVSVAVAAEIVAVRSRPAEREIVNVKGVTPWDITRTF